MSASMANLRFKFLEDNNLSLKTNKDTTAECKSIVCTPLGTIKKKTSPLILRNSFNNLKKNGDCYFKGLSFTQPMILRYVRSDRWHYVEICDGKSLAKSMTAIMISWMQEYNFINNYR